MNYFGEGFLPKIDNDIILYITPIIGYKYYIKKWLFDFSLGYKVILTNYQEYDIKNYMNSGIQLGFGIKYFL
jgi:hypothetical protein